MKARCAAVIFAVCLVCCAVASALPATLSEAEYEQFYELSELVCDNWKRESLDLLREVESEYDSTAEELMAFLQMAADADRDHVWFPVHGGKKYHAQSDCSNMKDPRPTTRTQAEKIGFDACKRCKP